jgi:hypothetical protein
MRPGPAIFPSDVEEDEQGQGQGLCQHHRATSVGSLPQSGEESDTPSSQASWGGGGEERDAGFPSLLKSPGGGSTTTTLSTFHPGPTNHDRCPIALPAVCGETSDNGGSVIGVSASGTVTVAAAMTQTPCPNCRRCDGDSDRDREREGVRRLCGSAPRDGQGGGSGGGGGGDGSVNSEGVAQCEGCRANHHHRLCLDGGSHSDSNAYTQPPPPYPPRASSFSALPTTEQPLRPLPGVRGHCCGAGSRGSRQHSRQCPNHRHNGENPLPLLYHCFVF